jgi:pyruvate kinase
VMIARGDLAVEVWFDTLATTQEHILALCQAAHIPVIYATDILKNKMKKNENSRAEVIDASFAAQASCIMLNKWPYLIQALDLLQKIQR